MATKPFDPNLLRENDKKARNWVRSVLPEGYTAVDNPDKYGVDLLIYKNGEHIFNIEPEVKKVWKAPEEFPWKDVQIPIRKSKMAHLDKPTLFFIFRNDGEKYFCVWDRVMNCAEIKMVPNKYVRSGELFFCVRLKDMDTDINKALRREWKHK